jgi:hypothetical protein
VSASDRALALEILEHHKQLMETDTRPETQEKRVRSSLKPLRERRAVHAQEEELEVTRQSEGPVSFHSWLSDRPEGERLRDIRKSRRITEGMKSWPLGWLKTTGVVCYERAAGRIEDERGGAPDVAFMRSIVKTTELPTAVAQESDHYVVVGPGGNWTRFMSVGEVARSSGLSRESPVSRMLLNTDLLTPNQAVASLGRAVHASVARQLVATLRDRGVIGRGLTYGSVFSGIDTFAAGLEDEIGPDWEYVFASECNETTRQALLGAWGPRGLADQRCHRDGRGEDATSEKQVDLVVLTGNCEPHSRRNHRQNAHDQHTSLKDIWRALAYVRNRRPKVLIVENVADASAASGISGLLRRLDGYTLSQGMLDPRSVASMPVARERMFWVCTREVAVRDSGGS